MLLSGYQTRVVFVSRLYFTVIAIIMMFLTVHFRSQLGVKLRVLGRFVSVIFQGNSYCYVDVDLVE